MNPILMKHNSLMERIVRDYGGMIRSSVQKALGAMAPTEDLVGEIHFAVFMTLRKLGEGWAPPRSFVSTVVKNKVNDLLWRTHWDKNDIARVNKHRADETVRREEAMAHIHTLTQGEFKVFRLLGLGLTNQEIAETLFISPLTVRTHVKRIHSKCGIQGRARLALAAYQACYRDQADVPEAGPGLVPGAPGGYLKPNLLHQQAN
ncbi:MAG TPA: LuxR C-terminal-related transcriptional regulator [Candidatus Aminicenantes bacterium]|nr:LuxR C-terminal-related transcriptional regulator [Candidatus Aminicenantes bacterium]